MSFADGKIIFFRDKNTAPVGSPGAAKAVSNLPPLVVRSLCGVYKGGFSMVRVVSGLTVLFQDPFWVGIYERECSGRYEACKVTFGAEPKDYEVYDIMLRSYFRLRFSPALNKNEISGKRISPKRMQRSIQKQLQQGTGIGTKAQEALKLQQEQNKLERKSFSREAKDAENERRFLLRQKKKKEKHCGH